MRKSTPNDLAIELIKDLVQTDLDAVAAGTSLPARESVTLTEEFNAFPKSAHYYFESLDDIKPVSPANFSELESNNLGNIMSVSAEEGLRPRVVGRWTSGAWKAKPGSLHSAPG